MKAVVVIVSYNPLKWIKKCLDSLLQSSISVDIIIVDNNSTDGFQEIIKFKYPQVELIQCTQNLGFGAANNIGIKKAYEQGADFVFLLNQDAWVQPDTIEKLILAQQNQPEFGIVSPMHLNGKGDQLDYNFSNYIIPFHCKGLYSDIYLKKVKSSIYPVDFVNAAGWLLSRRCIETVGGFNPSFFHYGEDDNYCQRVAYHGLKIGILPNVSILHDREIRQVNFNFHNSVTIRKRQLILRYSNPRSEEIKKSQWLKKITIKGIIKNLLLLRFNKVIAIVKDYRFHNSIPYSMVCQNRELSKKQGLIFIDNDGLSVKY